ncbi:MAG: HAD hydrolase-like protein [Oscillospiraceae bacterium]|nr:HAD hydrolase-like protein [Oscillospiraceae bacterium]
MYKYVLFDFDGTVYDTVEGITKSVQYALAKHGIASELNELRCFAGPPLVDKFIEVYNVTEEQAHQLVDDYRERYRPIGLLECRLFDGMRELLLKLREQGIRTAITTMKPQEMAEMLLEREGMINLFDVIYGSTLSQNLSKQKLVEMAIDTLGADRENTILVGDTKYDIHGAHQAGIVAVGVRYGYAAENELEDAGADFIVDTMQELEAFLLK